MFNYIETVDERLTQAGTHLALAMQDIHKRLLILEERKHET